MRQRVQIVVGVLLVAALSGLFMSLRSHFADGELGEKAGWAALQALEYRHRADPSPGTVIERIAGRGLVAVGFEGFGAASEGPRDGPQSQRSWVLLNEHAGDREVKQMPRFSAYGLRCSEVDRIEQQIRDADSYAIDHLRSICR